MFIRITRYSYSILEEVLEYITYYSYITYIVLYFINNQEAINQLVEDSNTIATLEILLALSLFLYKLLSIYAILEYSKIDAATF